MAIDASDGAATPMTGISSRSTVSSRRSISPFTRARSSSSLAWSSAESPRPRSSRAANSGPYSARRDGKVAS